MPGNASDFKGLALSMQEEIKETLTHAAEKQPVRASIYLEQVTALLDALHELQFIINTTVPMLTPTQLHSVRGCLAAYHQAEERKNGNQKK